MTEQQYRLIADRDKGDDPQWEDVLTGDRATSRSIRVGDFSMVGSELVRIERPVPTTDEPQKPELVTLHLYRDTCVGGLFLSERELDRTLHEHVEALTIRRDRLPVPSLPTREQISSAIGEVLFNASNYPRAAMPHILGRDIGPLRNKVTDAVLALLQKGAER